MEFACKLWTVATRARGSEQQKERGRKSRASNCHRKREWSKSVHKKQHRNDISTLRITPIKRDLSNQFNHLINFASRFPVCASAPYTLPVQSDRRVFHFSRWRFAFSFLFFCTPDLFHSFRFPFRFVLFYGDLLSLEIDCGFLSLFGELSLMIFVCSAWAVKLTIWYFICLNILKSSTSVLFSTNSSYSSLDISTRL